MNVIYKKLNIPSSCHLGNTIYKKMFYDMGVMTAKDKSIFKDDIAKITWSHSISPKTINIPKYSDNGREYDEIAVIEVALNDNKKYNRICEVIQQSIPYPIILILNIDSNILLSLAQKRTNQSDSSKNTIEEHILTEWIDADNLTKRQSDFLNTLDINSKPFTNLYEFYNSYVNSIIKLNASLHTNDFESVASVDADEVRDINAQINKIDLEMVALRSRIKKESNFNAKIKINVDIKKMEQRKNEILERLK